jgi:hypothetical protein
MNRIRAFKRVETREGVDVWELSSFALLPSEVIGTNAVSWQPSAERVAAGDTADDNDLPCVTHAVRDGDGVRRFRGYVRADNVRALTAWIRKRYAAVPGATLTPLLGTLGTPSEGGDPSSTARVTARALEAHLEQMLESPRGGFHHRRRRTSADSPGMRLGVTVSGNGHGWSRVVRDGHTWAVRCHTEGRVWVAPSETLVGGHRVPGEVWATLPAQPEDPVSWWDGTRSGVADRLSSLPFALRARLEAHGRPLIRGARHGQHLADLVPAVLVRVPSARERQRLALAADPPSLARFPGVMLRSAWPVAIPATVPVVDDPAEAASILCRAGDGMAWVPHAHPALPRDLTADGGTWRVLCRLGALLPRAAEPTATESAPANEATAGDLTLDPSAQGAA